MVSPESNGYSASPDLLALILQRVSKQSIPAYLQEHLFDPIGMVDTGYNLTETQAERVMQLHTYDEEGTFGLSELQVPTKGNTVYGGTHGLFSTVKDYTKFCQVFLNEGKANGHQIITSETVALMRKNAVGSFWGNRVALVWALGCCTIVRKTQAQQLVVNFIGAVTFAHILSWILAKISLPFL